MSQLKRRHFLAGSLALGIRPVARSLFGQAPSPPPSLAIDDFFRDFTADWLRHDPSRATAARYFMGDEQDRLDRQLTSLTLGWQRERVQRDRHGLERLATATAFA